MWVRNQGRSLSEDDRQMFEERLFFNNEAVSTQDIMNLAQKGGSFDFLNEEPDIYTLEDGEAI